MFCARKMTDIARQLVHTKPLRSGDGYTWTLASQLGHMLCLAESRFGPRDRSYTILGVEFVDDVPQCWFPRNCRNIVIQLGSQCLREPDRACFQLAHESIHLLSPTGGRNANVLEEGLATHFQTWYMVNHYPADWPRSGIDWSKPACQSYQQARDLVEQMLELNPDAIKALRDAQPTLCQICETAIVKVCPGIPPDVASKLAAKFER